jgi:hypothetical protein
MRTHEQLLTGVGCTDVNLQDACEHQVTGVGAGTHGQVTRLSEASTALMAPKRLLAGVRASVLSQLRRLSERAAADTTLRCCSERAHRCRACQRRCSNVFTQAIRPRERLTTLWTNSCSLV